MDFWTIIILIIVGYSVFNYKRQKASCNKSSVSDLSPMVPVTSVKQGEVFNGESFPSSIAMSSCKNALVKQELIERRSSRKSAIIEKPTDFDLTKEKQEVLDILENTNENVFLTGKAGTGKSNFLRYFRATTTKKVVVLAFTGVAAVNVQGQTIHSFFGWNPRTTIDDIARKWGSAARIYKEVDTIVIDEISMVRADLLDCIDKFMRLNGPFPDKPFGGIQVFVIGDILQLPPIVKGEDEERFFTQVYKSPFFFDSKVYCEANFIEKKLTEVYRQNREDQNDFINALNNIRTCSFNQSDLDLINTRFNPDYTRSRDQTIVSLVPTNKMADSINITELSQLLSEPRVYEGTITGDFKENNLPTDINLVIKEGSQVMLLNNDPLHRWVNGDIAKIIGMDINSVRVIFDDNTFDDVGFYKWDSIKFIFDEGTGKIKPEVEGTFVQLPIRLAWAVTIHKAQGKTFDKIHIDFGNGTFASGQAYVALSRSRKLEGIILTSLLRARHVFVDDRIMEFINNRDNRIINKF